MSTTATTHARPALRIWMGNCSGASFRVKAAGLEVLSRDELPGGGRLLEATVPRFERVAIAFSGKRSNTFLLIEPSERELARWFQGFGVCGRFRIVEEITDPEQASLRFRGFPRHERA